MGPGDEVVAGFKAAIVSNPARSGYVRVLWAFCRLMACLAGLSPGSCGPIGGLVRACCGAAHRRPQLCRWWRAAKALPVLMRPLPGLMRPLQRRSGFRAAGACAMMMPWRRACMNQIIHIHPEAPPKPALGAACNGCGVCCLAEPCPVGVLVSRRLKGACRALVWRASAGRYQCGLLVGWSSERTKTAGRLRRLASALWLRWARRMISAGSGCDANMEVLPPATPPDSGDASEAHAPCEQAKQAKPGAPR
jgi:hypothetical protein